MKRIFFATAALLKIENVGYPERKYKLNPKPYLIAMKTLRILFVAALLTFVFQSCKKDAANSSNNIVLDGKKQPPVIASTTAISSVTATSAASGGTITDDGGANITSKGICWSVNPGPTIANSKTNDGGGKEAFASALSNLESNTEYYVRSYATNSAGTSYGNEVSFTTLPMYRYSAFSNIADLTSYSNFGANSAYIAPTGIYVRTDAYFFAGYVMTFKSGASTFIFGFPGASYSPNTPVSKWAGFFAVDNLGRYLYVVVNQDLYKCDLSSQTSNPLLLAHVGNVKQMRILPNNDIVFSTDLNDGSIQKLPANSSSPQALISSLILPYSGLPLPWFDVINGDYYFTINVGFTNTGERIGKLKKITSDGVISTLIDNLQDPERIIGEKSGNLVIETHVTIDGNDYSVYTIYQNNGVKIQGITDNTNKPILSGDVFFTGGTGDPVAYTNIPLFVDTDNNLFFAHSDYVEHFGYENHCWPFIGGASKDVNIYKIQLIKQ